MFPASRVCTDPRWGPPTRFHLHESVVQKAVAHAARQAGITKRVGPHIFRHSFATCSRTATTFGRCRSYWATRMSARRWYTRTCSIAVRWACAVPSTASERIVQCGWPRELAANHTGARLAEVTKPLICSGLTAARWWWSCGRPRAGAANLVLAANDVQRLCGRAHVNIRAHKDMRSEYVGGTVAYGREVFDRSTP